MPAPPPGLLTARERLLKAIIGTQESTIRDLTRRLSVRYVVVFWNYVLLHGTLHLFMLWGMKRSRKRLPRRPSPLAESECYGDACNLLYESSFEYACYSCRQWTLKLLVQRKQLNKRPKSWWRKPLTIQVMDLVIAETKPPKKMKRRRWTLSTPWFSTPKKLNLGLVSRHCLQCCQVFNYSARKRSKPLRFANFAWVNRGYDLQNRVIGNTVPWTLVTCGNNGRKRFIFLFLGQRNSSR